MVTFLAFYERRFGAPSHQFFRLLFRQYDLELHNLTPSRVLYIMTLMTLCEAYMRIDPQLDLWNYFFRVWRPRDLDDAVLIVSRDTIIHIKSGYGVNPYFNIPMPRLMKGWQKKWFYLRNN
jgi:hypothetical protein